MSKKKLLAIVLTLAMVLSLVPQSIFAAAGETPEHEKKLYDNKDGTYTISLSVKGDSEKKINKTNVIMILDASNSMYVNNVDGTAHSGDNGTMRIDATLDAMENVASKLLAYNSVEGNPEDTVEVALIAFAPTATVAVLPTTTFDTFKGEKGGSTANCAEYYREDHNYHGTNWEAALQQVPNVSFGENDTDPTYVIFFTDGQPTRYVGQANNNDFSQVAESYSRSLDEAKHIVDDTTADPAGLGYTLYSIFAFGDVSQEDGSTNFDEASAYLKQLTNYAYTGTASTANSDYFYSASNTTQLQKAFDDILSAIELAGIGNVGMNDGTTSNVSTSSGDVSLLTVDTSSFKYYRGGGSYGEYDPASKKYGTEWTDKPSTVNDAKLDGSAVKWDIGTDYVLENDIWYTVTFDCWPSQTTLDLMADLQNGIAIPADLADYFDEYGNLKTNTTATLSWTDNRPGADPESPVYFVNPDPVEAGAVEQLAVAKEWENDLDRRSATSISLSVLRDGAAVEGYDVELKEANNWKGSVYISKGIMRVDDEGNVTLLTTGHNFTFAEPENLTYHWELDVPVVRPMIVNGEDMTLIKVDDKHQPAEGATVYNIPTEGSVEGGKYYQSTDNTNSLTATNYRRSSLQLTKVVEGDDAPADAVFPFTIKVKNSLAPEKEPENDTKHETDYWVWISVRDADGKAVNEGVTGATPEDGSNGYYYAPNETEITVNAKAGYSIQVSNLPTGSTYTITEGDLGTGFEYKDTDVKLYITKIVDAEAGTKEDVLQENETDSTFKAGRTSTGTIENTNRIYRVTYTNEYTLVDVTITKVWDDTKDAEGIRPSAADFAAKLTLKADGTAVTATPTVTDNGDDTYTVVYKGLPAKNNDKDIVYTVTEAAVDGYYADNETVENGGKITNTHPFGVEEEFIDVTVKKVWDDADDADKMRPATLTLTLKAGETEVKDVTPTVTKSEDGNTWTYTWKDLPKEDADGKEIKYTVTEADIPAGYLCETATVENGGTITNSHPVGREFEPAWGDPPVVKVLTGDKPATPETFKFKLTAVETTVEELKGKMPMPEDAKGAQEMIVEITGEGETEFGAFPFEYAGEYTYTITEVAGTTEGYTYDKTVHTIVYTVTLNSEENGFDCVKTVDGTKITGEEKDKANVSKFTFTNDYKTPTVEVAVTKSWKDNNDAEGARPASVTVKLLADGKAVDGKTLTLNGDNGWTGSFKDLPKYAADGKTEVVYTIEEVAVAEYKTTIAGNAKDGFVITNTYDYQVPPTGDTANTGLYIAVMAVSILAMACLVIFGRRRKHEE